jgi:hypothetical protein
MKTPIRIIFLLITAAVLCNFLAGSLQAAESARVQVILVEASNSGEGVDGSLRQYAGTLQRLFRFKSYKQVTRKSMNLEIPGQGSVSLSGGQSLTLKSSGSKRSVSADLTWSRGSKRLVHTRLQLRPGSPAVLGGPSSGSGGNYLLILVLD